MSALALLVCGAIAVASEGIATTYHPHLRVVGGVEAQRGLHRYVVGLKNETTRSSFCGASLVAPDVLLTAAHCVEGGNVHYAAIGTHNLTGSEGGEMIAVEKTFMHPKYNKENVEEGYDVAIVKLKNRANKTKPIAISFDPIPVSSNLIVRGWGRTTENGTKSNVLLEVQVKLWEDKSCSKALNTTWNKSMFCAGGEKGKDSCKGDSGGPIVLESKGQSPLLVGVVSWGHGCGRVNQPGVYARLSETSIVEFIKKYLPRVV